MSRASEVETGFRLRTRRLAGPMSSVSASSSGSDVAGGDASSRHERAATEVEARKETRGLFSTALGGSGWVPTVPSQRPKPG